MGSSVKVAFLPVGFDANPYIKKLSEGLQRAGAHVLAPLGNDLLRCRADLSPDVVHIHWLHPFYASKRSIFTFARVVRFVRHLRAVSRAGVGLVWTVHNLRTHDFNRGRIDRLAGRRTARVVDAMVVHCEAVRPAVAREFGVVNPSDIQVVQHANYCEDYSSDISASAARRRLGLPSNSRVLAFIGSLNNYKGIENMVAAFRQQPDQDAILLIAGKPRNPEYGRQLVEMTREDARIRLTAAFVPDEDMQLYLKAADCVVLPYNQTLTSGSAILAASFARACLVPKLGCMQETLGPRGAVYFDQDDESDLKRAMRRTLDLRQEDLKAMGEAASQAVKPFTWDTMAAGLLGIYRDVLERRGVRGSLAANRVVAAQ